MNFKLIILSCLLLAGCSVTVDDRDDEEIDALYDRLENVPIAVDDKLNAPSKVLNQQQGDEGNSLLQEIGDILGVHWQPKQNDKEIHFVALGDSLTRGIGDEEKNKGYTGRLTKQLEQWPAISSVELDNRGKNGRRSDQLLKLLVKGQYEKILPQADLVTVTIGGNDVMKVVKKNLLTLNKEMFDKELIDYKVRYQNIMNQIRHYNSDVPIVLIGFYNPFSIVTDEKTTFEPIIDEWNNVIMEIANNDDNACFVPVADLFTSNEGLVYHTDFFHPNAHGYNLMTNRIVETLQKCNIEEMSDGDIGFERKGNE